MRHVINFFRFVALVCCLLSYHGQKPHRLVFLCVMVSWVTDWTFQALSNTERNSSICFSLPAKQQFVQLWLWDSKWDFVFDLHAKRITYLYNLYLETSARRKAQNGSFCMCGRHCTVDITNRSARLHGLPIICTKLQNYRKFNMLLWWIASTLFGTFWITILISPIDPPLSITPITNVLSRKMSTMWAASISRKRFWLTHRLEYSDQRAARTGICVS